MRYVPSPASNRRPGVVLLVVMAMLALFASLALSFVFYADSEAVAAALSRQALTRDQPDIDPEVLSAYFLSQMIYDTDNPQSALRGWSLARSIYGYNPVGVSTNYIPYNGVGRSSLSYTINFGATTQDNYRLINYQKFIVPPWSNTMSYVVGNSVTSAGVSYVCIAPNIGVSPPNATYWTAEPTDPYLNTDRRPEWYGKAGDANYRYVGGANPPWTAYDTNSLFLAQVNAKGEVFMPSFARPWITSATGTASDRYATLRPHASWNPAFQTPDSDGGGDVRNLDFGPGFFMGGGYQNNDSSWIDLGFPIMTAPNGTRFKPLFAPIVVDLSNRLHLWAHGNRIGAGNTHVSNTGRGPTEVNLSRVLNINNAELQALFNLKYGGPAGTAASTPLGSPASLVGGPFFAKVDADGLDPGSGVSSKPLFRPFSTTTTAAIAAGKGQTVAVGATAGKSGLGFPWTMMPGMTLNVDTGASREGVKVTSVDYNANTFVADFAMPHPAGVNVNFGSSGRPFPYYPSGWDNAAALELTNKPLALNPFTPTAPNTRALAISNQEALLRYGGTNAPALTSELFRRMPNTFANPRARNMVTLANWHLDRIAAAPYLTFDRTKGIHYIYDAKKGYPYALPQTPADYANPASVELANSDFKADWRATLGEQLRVNLNRKLTDYPLPTIVPDPTEPNSKVIDTTNPLLAVAQTDRVNLARDIYNALVRVTGAQDPNVVVGMTTTSDEYKAARWLAQIAVNMVDYVDNDDYITAFPWYAGEVVFGTELPRLVLNEAYAQNDNDPDDPTIKSAPKAMVPPQATFSNLNVWVELHNPFDTTPAGSTYPLDSGSAKLKIGANSVYQVVVCQSSAALTTRLRDVDNNLGDPLATSVLRTSSDWGTTAVKHEVLPANGAFQDATKTNVGFYVLGPVTKFYTDPVTSASRDPQLPTTHQVKEMSYPIPMPAMTIPSVTILLRRLAIPHLPPQANASLANYNPYITVDYLDAMPTVDNRAVDAKGPVVGPPITNFQTYGRKQPYTAHTSQFTGQTTTVAGQPKNTFYTRNNPRDPLAEWLVHLDRPVVNPLEILHVSGYKPHELTQQFVVTGAPFQHYAPWGKTDSLLYRVLDLLGVPNSMAGTIPGGRWPGNINLNTIMEPEIFQALCDSQDANQIVPLFTQAQVQAMYAKVIQSRNSWLLVPNEGTPFRGFADGDVAKTWLRPDPSTGRPLFSVGYPGDHPYLQSALLQKIYNNISATSNVFAIWWTVGYFEVVDETVRPARLGAEVGRSENRHIRHRFFAIVDRSAMQMIPAIASANAVTAGANQTMSVPATSFSGVLQNGQPWSIQPGMPLQIDTGGLAEVVIVKSADAKTASFVADFAYSHAAGATIVCRGNPGPQPRYNPHRDSGVVLHMSVIR